MSKLPYLDDSDSLVVNKTLASAIGLNESIALRQLHYWIEINRKANSERHFHDGCWWTFNTYGDWTVENFPFWSTDTVRRALIELEKLGLVETGNYNTRKGDQTKWYTINYARYEAFLKHWRENGSPKVSNRKIYKEYQPVWQLAMTNIATCIGQLGNLHRPLPETTTETTTKSRKSRAKSEVKNTTAIDTLILAWAEVMGYSGNDIGATFTSESNRNKAKEMLKWPIPATPEEIRKTVILKRQSGKDYAFAFLVQDIPILRAQKRLTAPRTVTPDTRPFIPMLYQAAIERGEMTEAEVLNIMSGGAA